MHSTDNKVALYFPTRFKLWSFAMLLKNRNIEIHTGENLLTCPCSERELENAISLYDAILVDYRSLKDIKQA